jgi:hypothetical protein
MNRFKKTFSIAKAICSFFLVTLIIFSCGKSLPTLDGVDLKSWNEDKNGCAGKRFSMQKSLVTQREKLLALGELQIVELLGKPDVNELSKRNQKFYYYYLQSAKDCNNNDSTLTPKRLAIRFNAMGLAKEVNIE